MQDPARIAPAATVPVPLSTMIERRFAPFSAWVADRAGGHGAFLVALLSVLVWATFGPPSGYSDAWMLVINTGTTIVTFLMVFVIQSSQNRDTRAIQVKLDELIRATQGASNRLIDLEQLTPSEIVALQRQYLDLAAKAREVGLEFDVGTPAMGGSTEALTADTASDTGHQTPE